jgi:glucose-6-phosphate isomerase
MPDIGSAIRSARDAVNSFATQVHDGGIMPPSAARFTQVLFIGIGGSALGPMFVSDALGNQSVDRMQMHFIDNTDPDGIAQTLSRLGGRLGETLCIITSKSGGTAETRNGQVIVANAYHEANLHFPAFPAAITMPGSRLDRQAESEGWLARFPMFDCVGGRTSELSAVGLLPAALQGLDIEAMLAGAAACDAVTRLRETQRNPAALLALMWHAATDGRGTRNMVVLPYKDRLLLFSRYLQQLVMESLGKERDRAGNIVNQGITVYGNKGSTDQHAYVQQLREGPDNFFVTFIRVLESGGTWVEVEPGITAGDYLHGFLLGTREALFANGRQCMTITIRRVDARSTGALIALFERAVGLYAGLVGINAYHQPGVEAGKQAAETAISLQGRVVAALSAVPQTAEQIAAIIGDPDNAELAYWILDHLTANGRARLAAPGAPTAAAFVRADS